MIRVAVVDDQAIVRQGLLGLLDLSEEIQVVGEAADGDGALILLEQGHVDVLLLDLRMPKLDGIATLQAMAKRGITTATLVLTTFDDSELVLGALRAGARGYLLKDVTFAQLLNAIRTLANGGTLLQPALTDRLLNAITDNRPDVHGIERPSRLTGREHDVLQLAAAGFSNQEIASALHLAVGTVKNHMSNVLIKLGVRDRTQAVLRALELGLMDRK
jgi:DNA-binding NarL/FixJ family response regulator